MEVLCVCKTGETGVTFVMTITYWYLSPVGDQ